LVNGAILQVRTSIIFTFFFLAVVTAPAASFAEEQSAPCPIKPADAESAKALAKLWFDKGDRFVAEERYAEAYQAFRCSLRMVEHPATIFNAARAAHLAGGRDEAIALLEKLVAGSPYDDTTTDARRMLKELRAEREAEQEAAAEVDDAAAPAPSPTPEEVADSAAPRTEPEATPQPEPAPRRASPLVASGAVAIAVGAAGVVLGAVLQGLAGKAQKTTEETDDYAEYEKARSDLPTFQTGAIVGFAAGGALLGAGLAMALVGRNRDEHAAVSLAPAPGGLLLKGDF
jgi:tetratricopeptide (TPR) repeat protein